MVLSFGGIFIEMVKEMLTLFMLAVLLLLAISGLPISGFMSMARSSNIVVALILRNEESNSPFKA